VPSLVLDADRSRVRIRTFAEGLFARLAHDLELVCRGITGSADVDQRTVTLVVPIGRIDVAGILSGSRVDARVDSGGLSPSDREDCLRKMRHDVFHATGDEAVRVEGRADEAERARVRVLPPHGRPVEQSISVRVEREQQDEVTRVSGSFEVSLSALGSSTVKGPMNAFRVKDGVTVLFELVFRPNQPA
jgi:hypothetical protein